MKTYRITLISCFCFLSAANIAIAAGVLFSTVGVLSFAAAAEASEDGITPTQAEKDPTLDKQIWPPPSSPDLSYDSHQIDDDSSGQSIGDDNGVVSPAETIELYVVLRNTGSSQASAVSAIISTSDSYVTFLYNTASSYPDIPAGGAAINSDDFDFDVDPSCPNGHEITFDLAIFSDQGSWNDSFQITVYSTCIAPELSYKSHQIDDDNSGNSSGNGDGVANPGETIELYVLVRNTGLLPATGVTGTVETSDPYVTFLYNTVSAYPDMAPGETALNFDDIDFEISPSCPAGHPISFNLHMDSNEGGWSGTFYVLGAYLKLFWQNASTGEVECWPLGVDGMTIGFSAITGSSSSEVTVAGEIDKDGNYDLILMNDSGVVAFWLLDPSGAIEYTGTVDTAPFSWYIVASGDLDGDGTIDLIFRDSSGYLNCWLLNSTGTHKSTVFVGGPVSDDWQIAASGDIDGNGAVDLFWRHMSSGWAAYWMLNADGTRKGAGVIGNGPVPFSWQIEGAIDVNGDDVPDLLWRNSSGRLAYWEMNPDGSRNGNAGFIGYNVDLSWQVKATDDIDGDGITDLIWRNNTTGYFAYWLIDPGAATKRKAAAIIGYRPLSWKIKATGR